MRLSTIALAFVPILLAVLPVFASFHPPSGSLVLPSKIVTSSDGLQIFTESAGRKGAPAVIFLHGLGCTSTAFDLLFADPDLSSNLFMIRYDTRGHGRTSGSDNPKDYTSKLYADDFAAVAAAYGVKKPFYAGWSLAGAVAADLVANNVPISGMIWLAPLPWFGDILPLIATPLALSFIPTFTNVSDSALALNTRIEFCKAFVAPDILPKVPFPDLLSFIGSTAFLPPQRVSIVLGRTQDPGPLQEAAKQGMPLLLIHGKDDLLVDPKAVLDNAVTPFFTNAEVHHLDGVGHAPFYEAEKAVANYILKFVHRNSPSAREEELL